MMGTRHRNSVFQVCISLSVVFALALIPLPEILRLLRPNLVLLAMIYWVTRLPEGIGVGGACFLGFVYDGVIGSPLGLHALSFVLVAASLLLLYSRWRMFVPLQQSAWIFVWLMLDQLVVAWGQGSARQTELHSWVWVSALVGAIGWPVFNPSALSRG